MEIFAVGDDGALKHLESVTFPAMYMPNDLVVVGPRQFYASNGRVEPSGVASTLALALRLPLASVVYYDGREGRRIARGLVYANGINGSPDRRTIYVSEVLAQRISVFERDVRTGALTKRKSIPLRTAPDNIDVDRDGHLWVAGHSRVFDFARHARDAAAVAPSHVIKVDADTGRADDVFISVHGEINAASVGAVYRNTLVVGAALDGHVMLCDLPNGRPKSSMCISVRASTA